MGFLSDKELQELRTGIVGELVLTVPYQLLRLHKYEIYDLQGNVKNSGPDDWREVEADFCAVTRQTLRPAEQIIAARVGSGSAVKHDAGNHRSYTDANASALAAGVSGGSNVDGAFD